MTFKMLTTDSEEKIPEVEAKAHYKGKKNQSTLII